MHVTKQTIGLSLIKESLNHHGYGAKTIILAPPNIKFYLASNLSKCKRES